MSAANACWIVLCKCMLDIKCSVLWGWSCAITKSFEFRLRTDEKMGLTPPGPESLDTELVLTAHPVDMGINSHIISYHITSYDIIS